MTVPFNPVVPPVAPAMQTANQIIQSGNQLFQQMVRSYTQAYNQVWNNPQATPVAIVAALGTNAQRVFALSAGLAAYLVGAGAVDSTGRPTIPTTMPAGFNYQANSDGSVTLTPVAASTT